MLYPLCKFLPVENLLYITPLSQEEVLARLAGNMLQEKRFGNKYGNVYRGQIIGNTFEIVRCITYRNSFLPVIKGEILVDAEGTKIKIHMRPHTFVLAFMGLWLGGVFMACILTTAGIFTKGFKPSLLIPHGMFLSGIALLYGAFKWEAYIAKKDLRKIFDAQID